MGIRRTGSFVSGVGALVVATAMIAASPAVASVSSDYDTSGVNIRSGPGTGYTSLGLGYPGQGATIYCQTGSWARHKNKTTGVTGYTLRSYFSFVGPISAC